MRIVLASVPTGSTRSWWCERAPPGSGWSPRPGIRALRRTLVRGGVADRAVVLWPSSWKVVAEGGKDTNEVLGVVWPR